MSESIKQILSVFVTLSSSVQKSSVHERFKELISSLRESKLTVNMSKVYGGDVLSKVVGAITTLLLIRGLTAPDYANYVAFGTVLSFIPDFIGGGINTALVRFSSEYISLKNQKPLGLYLVNFFLQLILFAILAVFLTLFSDEVNKILFGQDIPPSALTYGLIGGIGFLITQTGRSIFQAEENFNVYIKTLWLRQFVAFLLILSLFLLHGMTYERSAKAIIVAELVVASIIFYSLFRNVNINHYHNILKSNIPVIKEFFSSCGWLILYSFILVCFSCLDIFMLSHLTNKEELANYGVACRFYSLGLLLLGSIHAVLLPRFSRAEMQDSSKQRQFFWKWVKAIGWIIFPMGIIVIACKPIFIWVVGAQYVKSYYILLVFTAGIWMSLTFSPLVNILVSRREFKFLVFLAFGAFTINICGNYFLIPVWEGLGAAVITILSHAFINVTSAFKVVLTRKKGAL